MEVLPDELPALPEELSIQVLENDMLRKMIIDYVTCSPGGLCPQTIKTLRLVRKSWLQTVSDLFRKSRRPLFKIDPTKLSSGDENDCTILGDLVTSLANSSPSAGAPFSLQLQPEFFAAKNHTDFSKCLVASGNNLVALDLVFPYNGSMPFIFPAIYLPLLQKITVQFSDHRNSNFPSTSGYSNIHALYFLQTVFNATEELKEIHFKYNTYDTSLIPLGFDFLTIPDSVTSLYLDCPLKSSDLKILKTTLPKLNSLRLFATSSPYSDDLITEILDQYKDQLVSLALRGLPYQGRVRTNTLFRFPLMSQLESLTVTSQCWELEEDLTNLQASLPKLKELRMLNTRDTMFKKWTEDSKYLTVETLYVSLINVNVTAAPVGFNHAEVPCTLTLERTQALHLAFPNVVSLEITLTGLMTCGLKYIFMEMQSLEKLAIKLRGMNHPVQPSVFHWDSVFVGVPQEIIASLKNNPDFWPMFEINDKNELPSIRKLTRLKSLALVEAFYPASPGPPLISEMTFHFGFLRMPNLKHLLLHGRFMPSEEVHELWKREKAESIQSIRT